MKRVKAINGYTIYQITERDAKHDASKTAGEYEIYFSSDIRDYGISNSYPEFDAIDSLNVALELCSGNTAIAKEICENINTCVDFADVEKVEKLLDNGASVDEITEKLENGETFADYLNTCEWFDGELIIDNVDSEFSFVWDGDYKFTEYALNKYDAILNSTDFTITDNVIELTANTDENLIDDFLSLCAGYTSETYYNKCIITNN